MKVLMIMLLIITNMIGKDMAIEEIREDFYKAVSVEGNEDLANEVLEKLQKLVDEKYTATRGSYLGSITSKMSDYSFFPWSKLGYAEDGSKLLNQAIKEEPNNVHIRLNRLNSFINFPDFLKKAHYTQQDARWLISNLGKDNIPKIANEDVYKALAQFFIKEKDEAKYNKYSSKLTNQKFILDVENFKTRLEND